MPHWTFWLLEVVMQRSLVTEDLTSPAADLDILCGYRHGRGTQNDTEEIVDDKALVWLLRRWTADT